MICARQDCRQGLLNRRILMQLRVAWYDGEIRGEEEECTLLRQLVAAEVQVDEEEDADSSG